MFHWQLSNFVGASLEERTIRDNKLHFTGGCSILLIKIIKGKGPWERIPFFFNDSDIFLSILILIITSLAIHYFQNVFRGFSILVCIGVQVFCRVFYICTPPLARDPRSRSLRACLRLTAKRWKIAPVHDGW